MKAIISKYWGYILLGIVIIFLVIKIQFKNSKIDKLQVQNNISLTLLDTITTYKNKLNSLTYEIRTFNVKYSSLEKEYNRLDDNAKKLIDKIRILEKDKKVVTATNVHMSAVIDSLINNKPVIDDVNHTLLFTEDSKYLKYDFLVNLIPPSLNIQHLSLPNELFITHTKSKDNILVKVTNDSPYYKINDINSYVIPLESQKKIPFKRYIIIGGVGVAIGGTAALILLN